MLRSLFSPGLPGSSCCLEVLFEACARQGGYDCSRKACQVALCADGSQAVDSSNAATELTKPQRPGSEADWDVELARLRERLDVRPSELPGAGLGLFSLTGHKADELIFPYQGERMSMEEHHRRLASGESSGDYAMQLFCGDIIDAEHHKDALGRYANDGSGEKQNALFDEVDQRPWLRASGDQDIPAGAEILVSYGVSYWWPRDDRF
eukprot:TRINITY_DN26725_c0_g1_i1.p1 TRINITY_DN26725_c0_g1~~TRINITY_DN26725_c0_g1_i1.p1  ORF type:complete len:208 (-),score=38.54 TRINITY_DN26725_c0_g1_i1:361-984(-)